MYVLLSMIKSADVLKWGLWFWYMANSLRFWYHVLKL